MRLVSPALRAGLVAVLVGCVTGLPGAHRVMAQDAQSTPTPGSGSTADDADAWRFQSAAYGWLIGVSGNMTARGQTVDVNASFFQVVDKSDSVAAFMGYFEADKGKVGFYTDIVWTKLGFDKSLVSYRNPVPGVQASATTNVALTTTMTIIEAGGLYEVARWQNAPGSFTAIDALLGFRYWNNTADLNFNIIGSVDVASLGIERGRTFSIARNGGLDWVDPVLGLRLRHQFTPSQHLMVRGDVGGFGLASQFAWQAAAVYSYAWQFSGYGLGGLIGYRALGVSYVSGTGINTNGVDAVLHGPLVGFNIRF
ncbi:MAG TPA: hypothetical protein VFF19_16305 [Reyranella sp.]|jgi:hypothetical protein|nr:hypothetical protein [Reyranella sp.]